MGSVPAETLLYGRLFTVLKNQCQPRATWHSLHSVRLGSDESNVEFCHVDETLILPVLVFSAVPIFSTDTKTTFIFSNAAISDDC